MRVPLRTEAGRLLVEQSPIQSRWCSRFITLTKTINTEWAYFLTEIRPINRERLAAGRTP